jgi:hypothetical protein
MMLTLTLGLALLALGIGLGAGTASGFFALAVAGAVWLTMVGLLALRRATSLARRPVKKENLLHRPPLAPLLPLPAPPLAAERRREGEHPRPEAETSSQSDA